MYTLDTKADKKDNTDIHPAFLNFYTKYVLKYYYIDIITSGNETDTVKIISNLLDKEPYHCKFRYVHHLNDSSTKWYIDFESFEDYMAFLLRWL